MKLPVDFKAVMDEALDIETASHTPVSVSLYIDDSASAEVIARVRSAFASAAPHARITIAYMGGVQAIPNPADDMAVIVAGRNPNTGAFADELRYVGVPVMVATASPSQVFELAQESGHPIPMGDVVCPISLVEERSDAAKAIDRIVEKIPLNLRQLIPSPAASGAAEPPAGDIEAVVESVVDASDVSANAATASATVSEVAPELQEPYALNDANGKDFDKRMGEWVIEACRAKRLAFALAFPFVRRPLSLEAVGSTSVQNGALGVVMFIPGADMPMMTMNQCKMILQIAAAYGQVMDATRAKEIAAVVAGGFGCRALARNVIGVVPALGWAVKGAVGYAGTEAMGHAAIEYFENGGGASGLAGVIGKARDLVVVAADNVQGALNGAQEPEPEPEPQPTTTQEKVTAFANIFGEKAVKAAAVAAPMAENLAKAGFAGLKNVASRYIPFATK